MSNEPENPGQKKIESLLSQALPAVNHADERHYELDELTQLADARRTHGEDWEMPEHLSRCGLCLEAFQALLEGLSKLSSETLQRFVGVGKNGEREEKIVAFPSPWKMVFKIAAVAALLLVAVGLFSHFNSRSAAHVNGGTVALQDGKLLPQGAAIPNGATVTATEDMSASLADGSKVELFKATQVSFGESLITLKTGKLTASVTKQTAGKQFMVKTQLGDVVVVGTKFSVTSAAEDVVVYESVAGQTQQRKAVVQAVRVAVFEGVVRVKRSGEQASVNANQTAVLRENEPGIEVK